MAATTAEVITATGIFCIAMKYVPVNIKTIHEYHFWDPRCLWLGCPAKKIYPREIEAVRRPLRPTSYDPGTIRSIVY